MTSETNLETRIMRYELFICRNNRLPTLDELTKIWDTKYKARTQSFRGQCKLRYGIHFSYDKGGRNE